MKNIFSRALLNASRPRRFWETEGEEHIFVSPSNTKMGMVPSVSLPPEKTCSESIPCADDCYARDMQKGMYGHSIDPTWQRNYNIWATDPDKFFYELGMWMMDSSRFRMHVGGDCPNYQYFCDLMDTIAECPNCQVLVFTKKYAYPQRYVREGGVIPNNAKIILSKWGDMYDFDESDFPTSDVDFVTKKNKGHTTQHKEDAIYCDPNTMTCEKCFFDKSGCWTLGNGQQVIFKEH